MEFKKSFKDGLLVGIILGFFLFGIAFLMGTIDKPVIYFYPEQPTSISVELTTNELITASNPTANIFSPAKWQFIALPDSTLITKGKKYPYLFYETSYFQKDFHPTRGWLIPKEELNQELKEKLFLLGLNEKEADEFMEYWLQYLPDSKYYAVYPISQEEINKKLELKINPEPDSIIRVIIAFHPTNTKENLMEPSIEPTERKGFTVVEWGGLIV